MVSAEAVRNWIRSELPHIRPPSKGTLEALTEGSTTQPLWEFLTTRVLHPTHAEAAHAALALAGSAYEPRDEELEEEIASLTGQVEELQGEVEGLRLELEEDNSAGDGDGKDHVDRQNEDSQAICDVINAVLDDRVETLSEIVDLLHPPSGEPTTLEELLAQQVDPTPEMLEALSNHSTVVPRQTLLQTLQKHLSEAESRITAPVTNSRDMSGVMESYASDECLRAYKELQSTLEEHSRGAERVTRMAAAMGSEERNRLLWAQIEGEQAVLAYAREPLKMPAASGDVPGRDVARVEDACARLASACLTGLREVTQVFGDDDTVGRLEKGMRKALHDAEALATGCRELGEVRLPEMHGPWKKTGGCDCAFRKEELGRVGDVQRCVLERLQRRRRVVQDGRDAAFERFDGKTVETAVRLAHECRDLHAVRVRDELVSFVRQPGRAAAPWLVGG